ncbi:MAG: hypothetical protein ACU0BS_12350 [Hasllibacter sp.]
MAGMDLKMNRSDRGMSVFWMILIMGAGVFVLLAIVLLASERSADSDGAGIPVEGIGVEETMPTEPVMVGEDDPDATYNTDDVTVRTGDEVDGPDGTTEQQFDDREEGVDVEVLGDEAEGPIEAPASLEAENTDAGDAEGNPDPIDDLDQSDIVVDPDGTTTPIEVTPSGPEGDDDDPLTVD